jgi:hypothetical protein
MRTTRAPRRARSKLQGVLEYKTLDHAHRFAALSELTAEAQKLGLGY